MRRNAVASVIWCLTLSLLWSSAALAQTLNDQYEFYLDQKCSRMNFQRDVNAALLPGQAGPNLFHYCSGPVSSASTVGGSLGNASSGGGEAAEADRNQNADEDAALRRRRERARKNAQATAPLPEADHDFNLLETNTSSVFLSFDYLHQRQQLTQFQDGSHAHSETATLGVDHRFAAKGVIGFAARYAALSGDFDSGGDFQSHTTGGTVYASWFPTSRFFIDVDAGFDGKHVNTQRIVSRKSLFIPNDPTKPIIFLGYDIAPAVAASETHSRETLADVLAGYDFSFGRFTLGPRAALRMRDSSTDAFKETGDTPMTLLFDKQTEMSLRSAVGFQTSTAVTLARWVMMTQLNVDWTHEFREDQKLLTARFAEDLRPDPTRLQFLNQAPDRDAFEARLSAVAILPHDASFFLSLTSNFGNNLLKQYGASLGGRLQF